MKRTTITPIFVNFIPEELNEGVIYISETYNTVVHRCCCGCGQEVVTPLSPVDWHLKKEGNFITIRPSIGNWSYPCQSHYLITRNKIEWAGGMTKREIQRVQERDHKDKKSYISKINAQKITEVEHKVAVESWILNLWTVMKKWWKH